ncbi:MAG: sodium:solute symporter family protein [Gammaproteobacteria bacterium]|nr:sodium:solute symporter family protein [Gammaproteobacteria bacterium]
MSNDLYIAISIVGGIYILGLIYCSYRGRKELSEEKKTNSSAFMSIGSGIGPILGFLTFAATLFSTFTLMGIPNFFRTHGVGTWIFLGVTDVAMGFVILWFGIKLHKKINTTEYTSVSKFLNQSYGGQIAGFVYMATIFIFLLPYVAIQIRGIGVFLEAVVPLGYSKDFWMIAIVFSMLIYSAIGGLKAIIYSDAIQGVVLLVLTWIVASVCLSNSGGVLNLFEEVKISEEALLSTPGPKGLFTVQFLIVSFITILLMPLSQPQLTNRIAYMRSTSDLKTMAIAVALFSLVVILPTIIIGFYGSVNYSELSAGDFIGKVLVKDQIAVIGAISIVGLIAAAMSTSDSILFALGTELKESIFKKLNNSEFYVLLMIVAFSGLAYLLAKNEGITDLVLLARLSFAGTALIAPMVICAIYSDDDRSNLGWEVPIASLFIVALFLLHVFGFGPNQLIGLRIDLALLIIVSIYVFSIYNLKIFLRK